MIKLEKIFKIKNLHITQHQETLLTQPLSGNRFSTIYSQEYRKQICHYSQNWNIKCIIHVKSLRLINGSIDENSSIKDQRDIIDKYLFLKKSWKPYLNLIGNH